MNCQNRYELYVEVQKQKKLEIIHLKRLVETRWAYWYKSLKKINIHFKKIREVLNVLSSNGDEKSRVMAIGYLKEISSQRFISILISMESILEIIHCASNELQNSKLLLPSAIHLINVTKQNLLNMRSNGVWEKLEKKIVAKAKENDIEVDIKKIQKRKHVLNKNLQNYFISSIVGKNISKFTSLQDLKTNIYFEAIDRLVKR